MTDLRRVTPDPATARLHLTHRIAADPTGTALLLAGPTGLDLWPGLRRVGEADGRVLVEVQVAAVPEQRSLAAASVSAHPPRRTPTAFLTRFSWTGEDLPAGEGLLMLTYAPGGQGTPSTHAELVLDAAGLEGSRVALADLTAQAEGFLTNLARAAEERRRAA